MFWNNSQPKYPDDFYRKIIFQEHLRQARCTFNIFLAATVTSLVISVIGAFLLIYDKAAEGAVTSATGLFSTSFCSQIAKESSEKLEELLKEIENLKG